MFTQTSSKDFKKQLSAYAALMKKEGISEEEVLTKKTYEQICSLPTTNSNFKYGELAELLDVSARLLTVQIKADEIEEWAISAIANGIIDAKIDQLNEVIVIKSHKLRQVTRDDWKAIQAKISEWRNKFENMREVLSAAKTVAASAK